MMCDFYVVCVENVELWDVEGCCFIDFVVGIVVLNMGYCYLKIVKVIVD